MPEKNVGYAGAAMLIVSMLTYILGKHGIQVDATEAASTTFLLGTAIAHGMDMWDRYLESKKPK